MDGKIVLASPALEKATRESFSVNTPNRRFGKSSLRDMPVVLSRKYSEYIGYFKLVHRGGVTFEVINGYDPEDEFCGYTDIPGCEDVPRFTFDLPYNAATISLCVFHSKADGYSLRFTIGEWNAGFTRRAIGNVYADGLVEQAYVAGGTIYFGRDYFL